MLEKLTIVCWKWEKQKTGFQLPGKASYTADHVNNLSSMLLRHCHIPFRLICFTDDSNGVRCETKPLPSKYSELGGCYRRLWMFSEEAKILGDRIASIDLDCVIVGNCTKIFSRTEDFIINTYNSSRAVGGIDQYYNGSIIMFNTGARKELWNDFDEVEIPLMLEKNHRKRLCIGSDQAWIRMRLGKCEARFTNNDGIYESRQIKEKLPENASIVFFSGPNDPVLDKREWVVRNWN